MSYGFDMGFAQANSLQEAMAIALEYTQSQMTEKNIRKTIRDNRYYIPSVRTGYIADEENKNRRADVLADTADRYWLEALFTFRFLYWEEHKLLGIIMMPPEMGAANSGTTTSICTPLHLRTPVICGAETQERNSTMPSSRNTMRRPYSSLLRLPPSQ